MKEVTAKTIGEAWVKSCKHIMKEGHPIIDDDKELKEIINLLVTIKEPSQEDAILEKHGNKELIAWMMSNFFEEKRVPELKNAKSYGTRLFNYNGKNQINWVIEKLKNKPESKAATITMIMHDDTGYIPCVSTIDFKIRNNKLLVTGMCRAIDFGKKVYANLLALNKLQLMVAEKLNVKVGELSMFNVSAHIYPEDFENIKNILKEIKND